MSRTGQEFTDSAMLELFRSEVESHSQTLSEGLLALEKEPGKLERIEPLMRAAHSIKGAARIVGVDAGVKVAHAMEDLLVAAQNGQFRLTSEAIDILLRGVDAISRIAHPENAEEPAPAIPQLLADIAAVREGRTALPARIAASPAPPASYDLHGEGPARTLRLHGDLDAKKAEDIRRAVLDLLDQGVREICLDLEDVAEIDAVGLTLLTVLITMSNRLRLRLVNAGPELLDLLHLTGLAAPLGLADLAGCTV